MGCHATCINGGQKNDSNPCTEWQQVIDIIDDGRMWGARGKIFRRERERTLLVSSPTKHPVRGNDRAFGAFIQGVGKIPYRIAVGECRLCELRNASSLAVSLKYWPGWARVRTPARTGLPKSASLDLYQGIVPLRKSPQKR